MKYISCIKIFMPFDYTVFVPPYFMLLYLFSYMYYEMRTCLKAGTCTFLASR